MSSIKALDNFEMTDVITIDDQVRGSDYHNDSVTFNYELNNKSAKAKLLKGSKRPAIEVEDNSTSSNLVFSVGAWLATVLPAVRYWKEIKDDKTCKVGDSESELRQEKTRMGCMWLAKLCSLWTGRK